MEIVLFCILKLISISMVSSQSVVPSHICEYIGSGTQPKVDIPFSVSDVPKRCELITYGAYYLDSGNTEGTTTTAMDEDAIKSLVNAGMPVYTYITTNSSDATWSLVLDPQDQTLYDQLVCPLIEKMKDLQVTGVILDILDLYNGTPDMANKISTFVTKLKEQLPNLLFGLSIYTYYNEAHTKIPNKELFDYSITNSVMDMYFISSVAHNFHCTPELSESGTIISCSDNNVKSLELLSSVISQSTMDQTKTIICVTIFPLTPNSLQVYTPYSEYCNTPEAANSTEWCLDGSQRLYDIGAYLKDHFSGIAVDWIQFDDFQGLCECQQQFPVTNTLFDGWDKIPITSCEKLN